MGGRRGSKQATQTDEAFMRVALKLARKGLGQTSPNPMVGAVLTRGDSVVGKGHHPRAGEEHAEVRAIRDAGGNARGATLYVNLEPCNHHGRTGPCVKAIADAGISRVVIGMKDPNPLVNGKGIAAMRRRGIAVCTGVMEQECRQLNEAFICFITAHRPLVTFKSAITLDGRVAARTGDSRWVTGEQARREGHRLRATHDAIIVGVGTVLIDNPQLTCREVRGRDPLRVVCDSRLRTPPGAKIITAAEGSPAATVVVTTERAPRTRERSLVSAGAEVARVTAGRRVGISDLLQELYRRGINSLLLEGGPTLAGGFWNAGLVDHVVAFLAPKVVADPRALPMVAGGPVDAMAGATGLTAVKVRRVGEDVMISGKPLMGGRHQCSPA